MKTDPPRPMHYYLQVMYAPQDKTKDTREINATTILALFTDTASSKRLCHTLNRTGGFGFAKM